MTASVGEAKCPPVSVIDPTRWHRACRQNSKIPLTQPELLIPPTAVAGDNFELSSKEETLCFLPPCIRKLPKDNIKGHHHSSTVSPWGIPHHDKYHHPKQCVHFRSYFSKLLIYMH